MNPYEVLQVDRKSTKDGIKRAHRRRARQTHPDAGGDARQFQMVCRAAEVLLDDEAREHFDKTGECPEFKVVDNRTAETISLCMQAFSAAMVETLRGGRSPVHVDFVGSMTGFIGKAKQADCANLEGYRKAEREIAKTVGRFTEKGGLLELVVQNQLRDARKMMLDIQAEIDKKDRALKYLRRCKYQREREVRPTSCYSPTMAGSMFSMQWE